MPFSVFTPMRSARRCVAGLALLGLSAAALPQTGPRPPVRNLLVELRQGDEASFEAAGAGLHRGAVTVGPDGEVAARAGVTFESRAGESARDTVQQVRVLNGGRASIRIGASVPMQWVQWAITPQGPVAIGGSERVETGRGFVVQPRWPGGDAPATVEIHSEASTVASGVLPSRDAPDGRLLPEGSVERSSALTTVQVPLGQWITVASSGETRQAAQRGVLSTRELGADRRAVVQLRVTAR